MNGKALLPEYEALNPCGSMSEVELLPLSPRVPDINGKTVYIVDSGVMGAYVFTRKVAELLPKDLPDVKVVYKQKPSTYMTEDPEFWDEVVKEAHAFIYGPAGGTSGFVYGARWSILLEKRGVPGVYVVSEGYEQPVQQACERAGMPLLRRVVTSMPPWGPETLDMQMPRIMKEIAHGLTAPLTKEEKSTGVMAAKIPPRIAVKGNITEVQEYFNAHNWTDGVPIIPPTEENVANMLAGTTHAPDEMVTHAMPPLELAVSVEKVAINGIMAGCKPADMPVLLAMVEAFSKGAFRASMISANSFSFMVVVNGPIAKEIGMNSEVNALGPGNPTNATIGRALRLFLTNLGGLIPGVTLMACQGNPSNYSFAFAENEKASPWEPLHVAMGYGGEESVVTIFSGGWSHGGNMTCLSEEPLDLRGIIAVIRSFQHPVGAAILLSPPLARQIADEKGFSKQDLQEHLQQNTTKTAREFRSDPYYSTYIKPILHGKKYYGVKYIWPARYLKANPSEMIPMYGRSDFIYPIVVGGENYRAFQAWKMAFPSTISIDKWR